MKSTELTKKQAKAFDYIVTYINYKGYSPSTMEISKYMGSTGESTSLGLGHIQALRKKGAVTFNEKISRSLRPVKGFKVVIKGEQK